MTQLKRRIILISMLAAILLIINQINIPTYFNVHFLQKYNLEALSFVQNHYVLAVLAIVAAMVVSIIFFIPLTPVLNITAGYFFGFIPGSIYCVIGATVGAVCSFLIFRYLLKDLIQHYYGRQLDKFNAEIRKHGAKYLLSLQLLPITPFGIIVVLSSFSSISLFTFAWTTFVGIIPGTLFYVYTGRALMAMNSLKDIWSIKFIIILFLLTGLAIIPLLLRVINKKKGE